MVMRIAVSGQVTRRIALALLLFVLVPATLAVAQAPAVLRVVLPPDGTAGLEVGADVLVLGLKAGTVRRIAFGAQQRLLAEITLDQAEGRDFIRIDSPVTIRQRLGGVGAAYLFIGRGTGAALDWNAATLEAADEPSQSAALLQVLEQIRDRALPVLDDVGRISRFAGRFVESVERGEGSFGRLMTDDQFARSAEETARELTALLRGGSQLVQRFDGLAMQAERLMAESGPNSTLTESTEFLPMLLAVQDCCLQGSQVECL